MGSRRFALAAAHEGNDVEFGVRSSRGFDDATMLESEVSIAVPENDAPELYFRADRFSPNNLIDIVLPIAPSAHRAQNIFCVTFNGQARRYRRTFK